MPWRTAGQPRHLNPLTRQRGASAAVRSSRGAEIQLSAAAVGHGHSVAPLQRGGVLRGADAAGCRSGCWLLLRRGSAPHSSVSLSACLRRDRDGENQGSLLIPLFVLSPSPSHTSSPRPPQINVPISLLPNPPLPLSMALINLPSTHPPLSSLFPLRLHP